LPSKRVQTPDGDCQNCTPARQERAWIRVLKPQAFTIAGSDERELGRGAGERRRDGGDRGRGIETPARHSAGTASLGDDRPEVLAMGLLGEVGSWETIAAPYGHHDGLGQESPAVVIDMLHLARGRIGTARSAGGTQVLQLVQNWGTQAGARTNHLCIDIYDLPHIPHRISEELGGAARYVIRAGVCPWCRLIETEIARRDRLVFEDAASVCFAPYASRSPFELWVVPRHHEADFGRATDEQLTSAAETLQKVIRMLDALDGPAYNLILHTAPLHERVDETYHWHWEIHPRLRQIAGLELGTGLPVNPVSPEEAVDELLAVTRRAAGASGSAEDDGRRTWDEFPRPG